MREFAGAPLAMANSHTGVTNTVERHASDRDVQASFVDAACNGCCSSSLVLSPAKAADVPVNVQGSTGPEKARWRSTRVEMDFFSSHICQLSSLR